MKSMSKKESEMKILAFFGHSSKLVKPDEAKENEREDYFFQ